MTPILVGQHAAGSPDRRTRSLAERLLISSVVEDSCLVWVKRKNHGYGRVGFGKRVLMVHRVAYELAFGKIPSGMEVDHICRNRACIRPDHLRVVTNKQNQENRSTVSTDGRSGIRGVVWSKQKNAWAARVVHNRKAYHFGFFANVEDAAEAARAGRNSLYTHNNADSKEQGRA